MRIKFIICGWHMNQDTLIDGLLQLEKENEIVDVFWSCHKEPPQKIKDNFKWKLFFNGAEEMGSYQQAVDYLELDDYDICFFLHDDMVVNDWGFIEECINKLDNGFKLIGNGKNPGFKAYDPFYKIDVGISEEFDNKCGVDYVKDENRHLFEGKLEMNMARVSFMCMRYKTVKEIGGFEPREEAYVSPSVNDNGKPYYRGSEDLADTKTGGLSVFGNLFPNLTVYKVNKIFGKESITWLSDSYRDSKYLHECERGEL